MSITIRQARPEDAAAIYDMIYELAVYEKAPEEVVTTPDEIRKTLFGADSKTEALVAEYAGHAVGYAVFFHQLFHLAWPQRHIYGRFVCLPGIPQQGCGKSTA